MFRCLENFCFLMSGKEIMSKDAHATSKTAHRNILQRRAGFLTRHCLSGVGPGGPAWSLLQGARTYPSAAILKTGWTTRPPLPERDRCDFHGLRVSRRAHVPLPRKFMVPPLCDHAAPRGWKTRLRSPEADFVETGCRGQSAIRKRCGEPRETATQQAGFLVPDRPTG
jgi:hypothetical protein